MKCFPNCEITRVAHITEPGSLFLCLGNTPGMLGQRVTNAGMTDPLILLFGPTLPSPRGAKGPVPLIVDAPNATAILLSDAEIELYLSADPQDWSGQEPSDPTICVAVHDSGQYVRVNAAHDPAEYLAQYVHFETGLLVPKLPGYAAYVRSWRVDATWKDGRRETLFRVDRGAIHC